MWAWVHLSPFTGIGQQHKRRNDGEGHQRAGAKDLGVNLGGVDDVVVVQNHVVGGKEDLQQMSINVQLTSYLTGLDLAEQVNHLLYIKHNKSSWIQTSQTGQPDSDTSPYGVSECSLPGVKVW